MSSASTSARLSVVHFAGNCVAIAHEQPVGADIVSFVFPRAKPSDASAQAADWGIRQLGDRSRLALYRQDQLIYLGPSPGALAEVLMGEVCRHLVTHSTGGAIYHAALVRHGARTLLLPGVSGAGKSTLTVWLCSRGCQYLTDELVYVREGTTLFEPLVRALSLKQDAQALVPDLPWNTMADSVWPSTSGVLVSPLALNPVGVTEAIQPADALFAVYHAGRAGSARPLLTAETGFLLLQALVNAPNLEDGGLRQTASLAQELHAQEVGYSHLSQLEPLLGPLSGDTNHGAHEL